MRPLRELPLEVRRTVDVVFCDLDDTLTTGGRLTADAYVAMERLSRAGIRVVPVTGRPAGWCDLIARQWPVAAVVGENGAFYFRYDHARRAMERRYALDAATRAVHRERLALIAADIVGEVPGSALAADQAYRETDIAIDWCEDVARLPVAAVERIATLMRSRGLTAKVSSIHVNGWFGGYDKMATARSLVQQELPGVKLEDSVFVGDSPNDAPMFAAFRHSVGVANVREFLGRIDHEPAYVTDAPSGAGFCEVARLLLEARR